MIASGPVALCANCGPYNGLGTGRQLTPGQLLLTFRLCLGAGTGLFCQTAPQ